jgi:3',5'-cyclic AMP phosphodiesterase CpdA
MKILHISDLHIRSFIKENVPIFRLLAVIEERYPEHLVILTGDIVDDGIKEQYLMAEAFLRPLHKRLMIVPGNHDEALAGNLYSPDLKKNYEDFDRILSPVPSCTTMNGLRFMRLNSVLEINSPLDFDFACGKIGEEQMQALDQFLSAGQRNVVFLHHHPFEHVSTMKLLDAEELLAVCEDRTDILMFGHEHKSGVWLNQYGIRIISASGRTPDDGDAHEIDTDPMELRTVPLR